MIPSHLLMVWCSMLPKTQLICFRQRYTNTFPTMIMFNGTTLRLVEEVSHLGHILAYNLDDKQDINRAIKELNRKANSVLCKFSSLNPFVKFFLIKSYCLSLYRNKNRLKKSRGRREYR